MFKSKKYTFVAIIILLIFFILDLILSSYHYYHLSFDGDITKICTPIIWYEDVLKDPFGFYAIKNNVEYSGAGRFMCHEFALLWFKYFYAFIYYFVKNPIVSIYLCSSFFATSLHILFIYLIYQFTTIKIKYNFIQILISICLSTVFIQYNSFYYSIGIIDRSISYTFFYALPVLLLVFYYSFFYKIFSTENSRLSIFQHLFLLLLSVFLAFSGALIQPIVFIISFMIIIGLVMNNLALKKYIFTKNIFFHFAFFLIICLYAFYVSKYNNEKTNYTTLWERYKLLLVGIKIIITQNEALIIIIFSILLNLFIINSKFSSYSKNMNNQLKLIMIFSFIYILLLPLGGYRIYRPFIIRYDTFLPVTLLSIYLMVFSTMFIIVNGSKINFNKYYLFFPAAIIIFFTFKDSNLERKNNDCQHRGLYSLFYNNTDTTLKISHECNLGTWQVDDLNDPHVLDMLTKLFKQWKVIKPYQKIK